MSVSSTTYTNASGTAANVNADGTANNSNQTVSTNEFLQLLITQLQNQDPTQPVDQTQELSQLAQFSELQQQTSLNTTETQNGLYSLLGQTVTGGGSGPTGSVTGTVTGITVTSGKPYLQINGQNVDPGTITQVTGPATASTTAGTTTG